MSATTALPKGVTEKNARQNEEARKVLEKTKAPVATTAATAATAATTPGSVPEKKSIMSVKPDSIGLILSGLGLITVIISLILQFFIIDHGSSNQLTIDAEVQKSLWGVLTGVILLVLGFILWLWFSTFNNKYLALFILSFSSYVVANIAVMLSLYQVTVTKV